MGRSRSPIGYIAVAGCAALMLAGCKYSNTAPPISIPCPAAAATLAPGLVTEYGSGITANSTPFFITPGPDGNLWFTEATADRVARITTGGTVTEFALPSGAAPLDITKGPAGNQALWFVESGTNQVGEITTSGVITQFDLPSGALPSGIARDQSGNLWFGEFGLNTIAKITTGGTITPYADSTYPGGQPDSVAIAPDNSVWFLDFGTTAVGHLTFPGGSPTFTEYALSAGSFPEFITVGPDGNLWLTEGIGRVARVVPSTGSVTEYTVPTQANVCLTDGSLPFGITGSSTDGDVWFAEADAGQVGRITPGGVITEYGIPGAGTTAVSVTLGPDNNIWFTDSQADLNLPAGTIGTNRVGKINIQGIPAVKVQRQNAIVRTYTWRKLPVHGLGLRTAPRRP